MQPVVGPGGEHVAAREAGPLSELQCGDKPLMAMAGARCTHLLGTAMTSGGDTPDSTAAFDGDTCSVWKSGGPAPKFAAVDFGVKHMISSVLLAPAMTERGHVKLAIEASDDGLAYHTVFIVDADVDGVHAYEVPSPLPFVARVVRVSTLESPSWVAWREIAVLECS